MGWTQWKRLFHNDLCLWHQFRWSPWFPGVQEHDAPYLFFLIPMFFYLRPHTSLNCQVSSVCIHVFLNVFLFFFIWDQTLVIKIVIYNMYVYIHFCSLLKLFAAIVCSGCTIYKPCFPIQNYISAVGELRLILTAEFMSVLWDRIVSNKFRSLYLLIVISVLFFPSLSAIRFSQGLNFKSTCNGTPSGP